MIAWPLLQASWITVVLAALRACSIAFNSHRQSTGSTASGLPELPVYRAAGGLYSYGAGTQTEFFLNPQWATHAFVEYECLTGSAVDSPLVTERGSPNQLTFGLGATYSFDMHPLW